MSADRELGLIEHYDRELAGVLRPARLSEMRLAAIRRSLQRLYDERSRTEVRDLRMHLRDRDAHIRNLEAQLRPYLLDRDPPQEAML